MIKLFEPFQSKIQLHIRQDFLQELWDKYVPVSSESYDHISLIYLKGMPAEAEKGKKQVQVLMDLVLKNLFMQINISQNPMLVTQTGVSKSLQYTLKHYLAQLKRTDLQIFQSVNRYMNYLRQGEAEHTRYEFWKKDSLVLRQMEKEYHVLQQFSHSLRQLSSEKAFEIEKRLGNDLIRSLKKTEYRVFAKNMVWQEREQIEAYIRSSSQTEYRQIVERLEKESALYELVTAQKEGTDENNPGTDNRQVISKEFLIRQIEEHFTQEEFWKFYHKAVFPEKEMYSGEMVRFPESILIWEKNRKRMIQHLETSGSEAVHYFWKQVREQIAEMYDRQETVTLKHQEQNEEKQSSSAIYRTFSEKLLETEKKYLLEMQENLHTIVRETEKQDGSEIIIEKPSILLKESSEVQTFRNQIDQIQKDVEYRLEEQKSRIVEQELKTLDHYQDVLHLKEIVRDSLRQEEIEFHMDGSYEREFLLKYHELHLSDTAVQKLWNWSNILLTNTEYELSGHIVNEHIDSKYIEDSGTVFGNRVHVSGTNTEISENHVSSDVNVNIEQRAEFQKLIENLNNYGEQRSFCIEYRGINFTNKDVQELIHQTSHMNEEQYSQFVSVLSDMMQVRQQIVRERMEKETELTQSVLRTLSTESLVSDLESEAERDSAGVMRQERSYYRNVERIFRSQYGTRLTSETVRKLYDWSEVLQTYGAVIPDRDTADELHKDQQPVIRNLEIVNESHWNQERILQNHDTVNEIDRNQESASTSLKDTVTIEDKTEFEKIIKSLNDYGKQYSFHMEYQESALANVVVQELLNQTRQMNQEQYSLFVEAFSNMIQVRQTVQERMERELTQIHTSTLPMETQSIPPKLENTGTVIQQSDNLYFTEVERIFRSNYGTALTVETVRKLHDWSKALQRANESYENQETFSQDIHLRNVNEEVTREEQKELEKLIGQINTYGEQYSFRIEYRKSSLAKVAVRELLSRIRQVDSEQQVLFIKALSEMIRAQQIVRERMEKESHVHDAERVFRLSYGTQLTAEEIKELHDWGEALQAQYKAGQPESEKLAFADSRNSAEYMTGDMQTEIIRQHIQQAKDRSEYHQLVEQVNHYAGEAVHLEYREELLRSPSIQKLIQHIQRLDEEHHRSFVTNLSRMIEIQQSMQAWESVNAESHGYSQENVLHREHTVVTEQEKESGNTEVNLLVQEQRVTEPTMRFRHKFRQRIYDIYPQLSRRIQEYEVQRSKKYETELIRLTANSSEISYLFRTLRLHTPSTVSFPGLNPENVPQPVLFQPESEHASEVYRTHPGKTGKEELNRIPALLPESQNYESQQSLQHAAPKGQITSRQQEQDGFMQEERIRMKSAQAQMDVRLKQVEQQLKQVEVKAAGKEDVRETAEKIKKLLHEELHLEKLRRGMI